MQQWIENKKQNYYLQIFILIYAEIEGDARNGKTQGKIEGVARKDKI